MGSRLVTGGGPLSVSGQPALGWAIYFLVSSHLRRCYRKPLWLQTNPLQPLFLPDSVWNHDPKLTTVMRKVIDRGSWISFLDFFKTQLVFRCHHYIEMIVFIYRPMILTWSCHMPDRCSEPASWQTLLMDCGMPFHWEFKCQGILWRCRTLTAFKKRFAFEGQGVYTIHKVQHHLHCSLQLQVMSFLGWSSPG